VLRVGRGEQYLKQTNIGWFEPISRLRVSQRGMPCTRMSSLGDVDKKAYKIVFLGQILEVEG